MDSESLFQRAKRKLFVGYDHQADPSSYEELLRLFSSLYEMPRDNALERELDTDDGEAYVRYLSDAMAECGCLLVLCGAFTHTRKFVDWEIKAALDKRLGVLGVILPTNPSDAAGKPILPERLQKNFDGGYAVICRWEELAQDKSDLSPRIDYAVNRPHNLIDNSLPLRARNG
jgi:hypothetical protein